MKKIEFSRGQGVHAFSADVWRKVEEFADTRNGTRNFIRCMAEEYSYIRLQDMVHPLRFLRQMAGAPPVQFGTNGFRPEMVDDKAPARHYTAFVFIGYWLPWLLGVLLLYLWEGLGFVRYHGNWSQQDVRMGFAGLRHGRAVRREGSAILPQLIEQDLAIASQAEPQVASTPAA